MRALRDCDISYRSKAWALHRAALTTGIALAALLAAWSVVSDDARSDDPSFISQGHKSVNEM